MDHRRLIVGNVWGYVSVRIPAQWPLAGLLAEYNSPLSGSGFGRPGRVNKRDLVTPRALVCTARHHFCRGSIRADGANRARINRPSRRSRRGEFRFRHWAGASPASCRSFVEARDPEGGFTRGRAGAREAALPAGNRRPRSGSRSPRRGALPRPRLLPRSSRGTTGDRPRTGGWTASRDTDPASPPWRGSPGRLPPLAASLPSEPGRVYGRFDFMQED